MDLNDFIKEQSKTELSDNFSDDVMKYIVQMETALEEEGRISKFSTIYVKMEGEVREHKLALGSIVKKRLCKILEASMESVKNKQLYNIPHSELCNLILLRARIMGSL